MKKIFALILPLFLLFSCGDSQHVTDTLDRAEQLMENTPDSALAVLNRLDTDSVREQRNRARLALLKSQALDKTYNDVKDDSLITIATDYYADAGDPHYEMLSQYYLGRVKFNNDEFAPSLIAMFQTLEIAKQLDDPFWTAMAAKRIGEIYRTAYNATECRSYYKLALENFIKSDKDIYIEMALKDYIMSLNNSLMSDSCIQLATAVLELDGPGYMGLHVKRSDWRHAVKYMIGTSQYNLNHYKTSAQTFMECFDSPHSNLYDSVWFALSSIRANHVTDRVKSIVNIAENDSDILINELKYSYYIAVDSPYQALKYADLKEESINRDLLKRISQDLSSSVINQIESQKNVKQLIIERNLFISITGLIALFLIIILVFLHFRQKNAKQNETILNNLEIIDDLRRTLMKKESDYQAIQSSVNKQLKYKFRHLDELFSICFENSPKMPAKKLSDELSNIINEVTSPSGINELEEFVNFNYDNIFVHFRADLPSLTDDDYKLYLFSILEFSTNAIATLLNVEKISSIYDRRRKVKKRIESLGEPKASLYISYL